MSDQPTDDASDDTAPLFDQLAKMLAADRPLWEQWNEAHQENLAVAQEDEEELSVIAGSAKGPDLMAEEPDLAVAGILATGEPVTAEDLEGMPWYEARVEIYVRNGPPGDEYGVGGDKIAHTRAATQAPSFTAAAPRLDEELGVKWQHILNAAPLADQAPSPDVLPVQRPWWKEPVDVPVWYVLLVFVAMLSLSALAVFA